MSASLPALLPDLVRAFLDDPAAVRAAVTDTPTHLVFPQVYARNLADLEAVLRRRLDRHRICYAHKVNQSAAFARTACRAGIGIDVASPRELSSALAAGFDPERVEVTGPKGDRFLREVIGRGVTISVDNLWELGRITESARDLGPVPILLRVSGFAGTPPSRFGIALAQVDRAFDLVSDHRDRITLLGFAFHLDSGETADRVRAVDACLGLIERAYRHGHTPSVLNIGGGLRQVFTADADRFDGYVRALRASLLGRGEPMSWGENTFGYHVDGGAVRGVPVFHKYANTVPAARMLDDLLTAPLERHGGRTVAEVVGDNLLTLWLEPGKALVDHAGITVATVEFTKELADGTIVVAVDLSRDSVTPADQEVMVDPLVLSNTRQGGRGPVGVYFAGRLCLERDMITNHKVWLEWMPRPGDLVVFPNTAAYHMDLSASSASMHPLPPKVAVTHRDGRFVAVPDADHVPEDEPHGLDAVAFARRGEQR
ncbi:type III PLP-dependent enzyme domain-containing protein [Nocardia bovistercoris]|uniref:Decarboxylase n=1 Tax=Nocardia bovistercoris TaxID=2785916 RepID=A0A931IEP7_9NOCA|nr:decarboxylase [Nocardia bovistercoris]MBH0779173.1 decarboxylase [Nocardia bovistercoris]